MSKRSERAKARMERKGVGLDKKTKRKEERKAQDSLGTNTFVNVEIRFDGDVIGSMKKLEMAMSAITFQRRDKRYRIKVDTN